MIARRRSVVPWSGTEIPAKCWCKMIVNIPLGNQGLSGELFMDLLVITVPCPHGTTDHHERPQCAPALGPFSFSALQILHVGTSKAEAR